MERGVHPPLVDTAACYCRVDTGLKTVAGARKFVPGSKLCIQPDIKPSIHSSRNKVIRGDRSRGQSPLLPGLPDDLAIACLIRVPRVEHRKLRLVCKRWYRLLAGNFFYSLRKSLGMAEEWIYVIKRDKEGKISWHAFDPVYQLWQPLPPVPGGECEGNPRSLRSAEVYDPNKNRWSFIADMSTAMVPFIGVVYEGRWFLKGLGSHRQVMSEVYIPESNNWNPVYDGMVAGWRNPSVSINGELYALDCKDGCKIRVYDGATDSWSRHIDSRLHLGNSRALEAAALVPLNGKLCIIRNNMSITLVDVSKSDESRRVGQLWETIAGKGHFKTFVTNLWSSIAGRNRLKSHIVHCQVLQA
ncbi:F-box/kelch-repeat protein At1g55270 isoform X2 [Amborella trichopoda]|uniref:F-box/kelch-repeat protein At1g55270 isoform X2 n=1 Tax=Amborella trichopoda TaxID=13333 RepID=UPI0009C0A424|nr:F-box/kelch-repeat protein At1g55270 isoform X2 [Amborella trichopoda]|eukprot:XP_020521977.1 F-box/kelch-repeat protein At1g55270 isoform X2 [Amborella trichopoda]